MKSKASIRYLGFRPTNEGGRLFDFNVSGVDAVNLVTSFEIPAEFFTGIARFRLQEGVGICYAKLKQLVETGMSSQVPGRVCLTAADMEQYREVLPGPLRRRPAPDATDRKIS